MALALVSIPQSHSVYFSSDTLPFLLPRLHRHRHRHRRPFCAPLLFASKRSDCIESQDSGGISILWFKHDLRIDDHPALHAASKFPSLVPLYVFDHRILSRFSDEMVELVLFAVENLRKSLREQGSDLMIKFGRAEYVIQELVNEVKATRIFSEDEVEYDLCKLMDTVKETLQKRPFPERSPNLVLWKTPFYDVKVGLPLSVCTFFFVSLSNCFFEYTHVCSFFYKTLNDLPASHDEFMRIQFQITSPLAAPLLPGVNMELNWGSLPSFDDVKEFLKLRPPEHRDMWDDIKKTSAHTILRSRHLKLETNYKNGSNSKKTLLKELSKWTSVMQKNSRGSDILVNALAAYLRYNEGTVRNDWQEIHELMSDAESRDGPSFVKLFGPALCLGIISRRRVHYEAIKYERQRNAGFMSPFGYSTDTIAAAIETVCSIEWYWLKGLKCQASNQVINPIRIWRWNGFLIQYTVVGCKGPAVLLVHGFGAFWEHYRDNLNVIAKDGNKVWAVTLLGFGGSEKPSIVYTELMWADLLRDFIIEVVGTPVHLVGNSIGGYIASIVTGLWPSMIKSLVLMNSAGTIIPGYSFLPFTKERRTSGPAWLGARLLLFFLRLKIRDTVKSCYPSRTERADDWLINEMLRASYDPGVLSVLESIFSFDLSIPLNYLLKGCEEKVLVIQGVRDPIYDSKSMLAMLREHLSGISIKELDAGHCPHDELPEEVNSIINEWLMHVESKTEVESFL